MKDRDKKNFMKLLKKTTRAVTQIQGTIFSWCEGHCGTRK